MIRPALLLCWVLCPLLALASPPDSTLRKVHADSLGNANYIARRMSYHIRYDFVDYGRNFIEYKDRTVVAPFFEALRNAGTKRVKVVHIGDSHVQADMYPGQVRNQLQQVFGTGGRGMIFPYRAAATHPAYDYNSYAEGIWIYDRNIRPQNGLPLGLSGATIRTADTSASFRFQFTDLAVLEGNTVLKIYCKRDSSSFDVQIQVNDKPPFWLPVAGTDSLPYITAYLSAEARDFTISFRRTDTTRQRSFECYGLMLQRPDDKGVLYSSVGINGATFDAVLNENLMPSQLREIGPDLVVLDISGNEYYGRSLRPLEFENELRTLIAIVKAAAPKTTLLVSCSQDIFYRRRYNIEACGPAAEIARRVAFETGCAFYNWFVISGGRYSMNKWYAQNMAKRDKVHLTWEGYTTKGELFANGLLAGYYQYLTGATALLDSTSLAVSESALRNVPDAPIRKPTPAETGAAPARIATIPPNSQKLVHVVRSGDVLGAIAEKYHVFVRQIMTWNGMRSTVIYPGQKLAIYVPATGKVKPPSTTAQRPPATTTAKPGTTNAKPPATQTKPAGKARYTHTVKSGENLWLISKKYSVTVAAIKQFNGLTSDALKPGQKILIP